MVKYLHFPSRRLFLRIAFALLLLSLLAQAQDSLPLRRGATELTAFIGGGTGTGKRSSTQMLYAGGRFGRVLTPNIFSGRLRGNVEYVFDALPIFVVFQPSQNAIGGGFNPFILKWNFTSGKRMIPFIEAGGGVLFTNHDVPVNTNHVNFTPQGGFGIHFLRPGRSGSAHRAITFSGKYLHISNAGLESRNSGINASVQFAVGYTWFK